MGLYELSLANPAASKPLAPLEVERRLGELRATGRPVLLSNIPENFQVTTYLKRFTKEPIRSTAAFDSGTSSGNICHT